MKHFVIYRKLILIIGTATAVVSVGVFFFMEDILFRTLFISFAFVFFTRDIVNKQNGYIKVASDEKGTIFSLFLKKV